MRKIVRKIINSIGKDFMESSTEFLARRPQAALQAELHKRSIRKSADFIETHMVDAVSCADKFDHLKHAASLTGEGMILEFGVYKGHTTNHLARLFPDRNIYGFDSFRGLPEKWSGYRHSEINFDKGGLKPKVNSNVELIEGWFEDTIPPFIKKHPQKIALLHIDCDIYSSTVTVLDSLIPFFEKDTIIVFDEFFNYPGYENHEYRAFFECAEKHTVDYKFVSYAGQQVGIVILSKQQVS